MTSEQLKEMLVKHEQFLTYADRLAAKADGDPDPEPGQCAELAEANLEGERLQFTNLKAATLTAAKLSRADLRSADLQAAELAGADISRAALNNTNLVRANLQGANLERADLRGANLEGANLSGANLTFADLRGANINGANLTNANLGSTGLLIYQFERHQAFYMGGDTLNIGGVTLPVSEWLTQWPALAAQNSYTESQQLMYANFISGLARGLGIAAPEPAPATDLP